MEILSCTEEYRGAPCVVAMGMFDGMHMGHRALIARAKQEAIRLGAPLVIYTYAEHPLRVLRPDLAPVALMSAQEKAELMREAGADAVIMNRFTAQTAKTPPEEFLRSLCAALHPLVIAAGYNHSFGHRGVGNAGLLQRMAGELGYEALILQPVESEGGPVSSSRIRKLLEEGKTREADRLLGKE